MHTHQPSLQSLDYPRDHPRYLNAEKYHEAGFDSFITSKVFLRLTSRLNTPSQPLPKIPKPPVTQEPVKAIDGEDDFIEQLSKKKKKEKKATDDAAAAKSRFGHSNPFDALGQAASTPSASRPPSATTQVSTVESEVEIDGTDSDQLIPQWNSDFWKTYGNKLRVYGTQEEECDLTAKRGAISAAAPEDSDKAENQDQEGKENGTPPPRRGSIISTLQESIQSLWLGKK